MSRWLIVSHDTGGAEVVSSWVRRNPQHSYRYCLKGPAVSVFKKRIGDYSVEPESSLEVIVEWSDFILTGTSWASCLEKQAIKLAKKNGIKVFSFMDHWMDYSQRFILDDEKEMPDEIWVGDEYALQLAKEQLPKECINLVPNPFFEDIKEELSSIATPERTDNRVRILYICEPRIEPSQRLYGIPDYWGYTEFEALENYLKHVLELIARERIETICIRKHPSEEEGKYNYVCGSFENLPLSFSKGASIYEDCKWADWVVGCDSMAMVIGLMAGKEVFSCIPSWGKPGMLPHKEIKKLFIS